MSPARETLIRSACEEDAAAISAVIVGTLRHVNGRDYTPGFIEFLVAEFAPVKIVERIRTAERLTLVAEAVGEILGTASLEQGRIRTVFVRMDHHGRGVGSALMATLEKRARHLGHEQLRVRSSVNAEGFYQRLGFLSQHDELYEGQRTIFMTKPLTRSRLDR